MKKQNAKVNYFFSGVYKDCSRIVATAFMKCIGFVQMLFGFCFGLIKTCFVTSWAVMVGVFWRLIDTIKSSWYGVCDSFAEFWGSIMDIIDGFGFWERVGGFFKALWFTAKFGVFAAYFICNLVFTPTLCIGFTLLFLVTETAGLLALFIGAVAVVVAALVVVGVFAGIAYVIMALIACGIGVCFFFMAFLDFLYRKIKKLSNGCPNCQTKFDLPVYKCPSCGREQTRLIPSKYGILKRECLCGYKMPTTFLNGRQKLDAICPNCSQDLSGGAHTEVWIPVIGGPSSGKTCYINMAISEISDNIPNKFDLSFKYHAQGDDMYEDNKNIMEQGMLPQKTSDTTLKYYQFYLNNNKESTGNFISLCDVAGEVYAEGKQFSQGGFKQADAFIVVVDPLSFSDYRQELETEKGINPYDYGASDKPMEDIIGLLFKTLDNIKNNTKSKLKPVCAVVLTKCDIPGIDQLVGEEAVKRYMASHPKEDRLSAKNAVCEAFLKRYGEANFLTMMKQRFTNYQFFTCTSLGHNADGSKFVPADVEDGILWILDKCCPTLSFDKLLKQPK